MTKLTTHGIDEIVDNHRRKMIARRWHACDARYILPLRIACIEIKCEVMSYITLGKWVETTKPMDFVVDQCCATGGNGDWHVRPGTPLVAIQIEYPNLSRNGTWVITYATSNDPYVLAVTHNSVVRDRGTISYCGSFDNTPLFGACIEFFNTIFDFYTGCEAVEHIDVVTILYRRHF